MSDVFFDWLAASSISGGIFVVAALLVRSCLKNVLPKRFLVELWLAVLAAFVISAFIPSPASIHNHIHIAAPRTGTAILGKDYTVSPPRQIPRPDAVDSPFRAAPARPASEPAGLGPVRIGWAIGLALLLGSFAAHYLAMAKRFAMAKPLLGNRRVDDWLDRQGGNKVRVLVSPAMATPVSFGIFRPAIILPESMDAADPVFAEGVLEHEYAHCRHLHNLLKAAVYLALAFHWFNPLAWIFWLMFSHDIELACDEAALERIGPDKRKNYAHSLLSAAGTARASPPVLSFLRARNIKERVIDIMAYKKTGVRARLAGAAVVLLAFALFGTSATAGRAAAMRDMPLALRNPDDWYAARDIALALIGRDGVLVDSDYLARNGEDFFEFRIVRDNREHHLQLEGATLAPTMHNIVEPGEHYAGVDFGAFMPIDRAERIALEALGGGGVSGYSLEYDVLRRRFIHEIEIMLGGVEYEVEIDAMDGALLKIEVG